MLSIEVFALLDLFQHSHWTHKGHRVRFGGFWGCWCGIYLVKQPCSSGRVSVFLLVGAFWTFLEGWCWGDVTVVQGTHCSCTGPGLGTQHQCQAAYICCDSSSSHIWCRFWPQRAPACFCTVWINDICRASQAPSEISCQWAPRPTALGLSRNWVEAQIL